MRLASSTPDKRGNVVVESRDRRDAQQHPVSKAVIVRLESARDR
jgi:hypothetical protein